jgi:hypothetical protein
MRMPLLLLCLLLLLVPVSWAQAQCPGVTTQLTGFAREELLIDDTVKSLTASIYKPSGVTPSMATVTVEGGTIRYSVVGAPTSSVGHPVGGTPAQTFPICGADAIAAFKATRITTDATLFITYYRPKSP